MQNDLLWSERLEKQKKEITFYDSGAFIGGVNEKNGFKAFLKHFRLGLENKYPICCVLQFSFDRWFRCSRFIKTRLGDGMSGYVRNPTYLTSDGYVDCSLHTWLKSKKEIKR